MSRFNSLGFGNPAPAPNEGAGPRYLISRYPLRRVMAFLGHSIDELCDDPVVKNKVFGYFKLYKQIERQEEVTGLERQWNPLGRRY
jgi:hypothetical protein